VTALGNEEGESEAVDTRPTVKVTQLSPVAYPVEIEAFGELSPLESTNLSAQVSGEITSLNLQFLSGGIIKRGEVLFTIEKHAYEAALL
ncbi:biotin/lipoyl-binding protein, partial [Opacimonas viscosa]|nr:efflux RND transporter periplasmic adaptor subunit [Opacimonas viscosa]